MEKQYKNAKAAEAAANFSTRHSRAGEKQSIVSPMPLNTNLSVMYREEWKIRESTETFHHCYQP
jgi:hypothetical protein